VFSEAASDNWGFSSLPVEKRIWEHAGYWVCKFDRTIRALPWPADDWNGGNGPGRSGHWSSSLVIPVIFWQSCRGDKGSCFSL